jgi:hypothetical protein
LNPACQVNNKMPNGASLFDEEGAEIVPQIMSMAKVGRAARPRPPPTTPRL